MTRAAFSVSAAFALFLAATASGATTYHGVRDFGGGLTGALTVTTDGTLGVLGAANVLDLSLVFSGLLDEDAANYGAHPSLFANAANPVTLQGGALSATRNRLFFDFDSNGSVFGTEYGGYYFLTSANCGCFLSRVEFYELDSEFGNQLGRSGLQVLGGVPDPENWAMVISGLGLTGAVMRRRRRLPA